MDYKKLLICYRSGQMTEKQWQEHLKDEAFKQWLNNPSHPQQASKYDFNNVHIN